jgi:hypothetical protein
MNYSKRWRKKSSIGTMTDLRAVIKIVRFR